MAARVSFTAGILLAGLLASTPAIAQKSDAPAPEEPRLRLNAAMILLDYQVIRVAGDKPIDLMGFHVVNKVADGVFLGAGLFAPLVRGVYGGFTAYDISAHLQRPLMNGCLPRPACRSAVAPGAAAPKTHRWWRARVAFTRPMSVWATTWGTLR